MSDPAITAPTGALPPRHDGFDLLATLRSANTHFVALAGIRTVYAAVAARIAILIIDAHYPPAATVRIIADTIGTYLVAPTLAGALAAFYGRPPTIPPSDAAQVAEAALEHAPRPIVPGSP